MDNIIHTGEGILDQVSNLPSSSYDAITVETLRNIFVNMEEETSVEIGSVMPFSEEEINRLVDESHNETTEEPPIEAIPVNSETLSVNDRTSRFSSAVWYNEIQKKNILLAGLGGIGSWTALLLARMLPRSMYIYDDDRVESGNMSGQLYSEGHLGIYKSSAIANIMRNYASYSNVFASNTRYITTCEAADIMICGFDNMGARKTFFQNWYAHILAKPQEERKNCLYIDGRLAAESFQVLCMRGDDAFNIARYRNQWLFSDAEAETTVCSYKQTSYCASMIASVITNLFVNFCANVIEGEDAPVIPRDIPFLTAYDAELMFFKTEA